MKVTIFFLQFPFFLFKIILNFFFHSPNVITVNEGDSLDFLCTSDGYYEWCTFKRHDGKLCDFEWKRELWGLTTLQCSDFESRFNRTGWVEDFQDCPKQFFSMEEFFFQAIMKNSSVESTWTTSPLKMRANGPVKWNHITEESTGVMGT